MIKKLCGWVLPPAKAQVGLQRLGDAAEGRVWLGRNEGTWSEGFRSLQVAWWMVEQEGWRVTELEAGMLKSGKNRNKQAVWSILNTIFPDLHLRPSQGLLSLVPLALEALTSVSSCPSVRFGFVQDKYSASAFNFPAENKPQYIHVTGEELQAKSWALGWRGRLSLFTQSSSPAPSLWWQSHLGSPSGCHPGPAYSLSLQEQCFCSCPTPSASSRDSSGAGGTPPAPPTRTCSARSGWATTGPTTPC